MVDIYEDMVFTELDNYLDDEFVCRPNKSIKKKSPISCYSSKHTRIAFQQKQVSQSKNKIKYKMDTSKS
jgi:hypothetical protein